MTVAARRGARAGLACSCSSNPALVLAGPRLLPQSVVSTLYDPAVLRRGERSRDFFGRRIPTNLRISFRRDVLAEALWEYGEEELAKRALALSENDLHEVQLLAVWHHENDPDPTEGPKLTGARIMSRAMIQYVERSGRDTKRTRRRTRPESEGYNGGARLPDTAAERGLDLHA